MTATPTSRLFAGVMTGTSMDAIDVAIIKISDHITLGNCHREISLAHFYSTPIDQALADAMLALQHPSHDELHRSALVANALADGISRAVLQLISTHGLQRTDITAVGVHGQTVRHQPQAGYTIQLNAPARIAETTGITVVSDFRSRDIAAGGQGAPLVPTFHQAIFSHDPTIKAVVNIGGIANMTLLQTPLIGYDTGPGNMLMDDWAQRHLGQRFDAQGAWAASGKVYQPLLQTMLADPFFSAAPPKSTGRDLFNTNWLAQHLDNPQFTGLAAQDIQATLLELTAVSIAQALACHIKPQAATTTAPDQVLICGGGAWNAALMKRLAHAIEEQTQSPITVASTASVGWSPQVIEAAAFAWLAAQTIDQQTGNSPSVTGALGPRILGAITPA